MNIYTYNNNIYTHIYICLSFCLSVCLSVCVCIGAVEAVCERVDARDSSFRNLLMAMFQVDPDKRITPHEALRSPFLSAS